jgi:integrase
VRLLPSAYRLALLWLDWSGARVSLVDSVLVGDYDEPQRRIRLRAVTTKTRAALWVELPDVLAEAIEATLPPREDRDPEARLFGDVGANRLRTAITRACRAAGVPVFSPHDLRRRRISLLHRQGRRGPRSAALSVSASSRSPPTLTRTYSLTASSTIRGCFTYAWAISSLFAPSSRMRRHTVRKASASWSRAKTFTAIGPSGIEGIASRS